MKYLPLYYRWMEQGRIPTNGLCNYFGESRMFLRVVPVHPNYLGYWGYRGETEFLWCVTDVEAKKILNEFTPLRQNIVLFMAAMNGEL